MTLPEWDGVDRTPMPWWVERGYHAFVLDYWSRHLRPPAKRNVRRYGR